jgi:hypothetical protein
MTDPIRGLICGVAGLAIVIFVIQSLVVGKIGYHGQVESPILPMGTL